MLSQLQQRRTCTHSGPQSRLYKTINTFIQYPGPFYGVCICHSKILFQLDPEMLLQACPCPHVLSAMHRYTEAACPAASSGYPGRKAVCHHSDKGCVQPHCKAAVDEPGRSSQCSACPWAPRRSSSQLCHLHVTGHPDANNASLCLPPHTRSPWRQVLRAKNDASAIPASGALGPGQSAALSGMSIARLM